MAGFNNLHTWYLNQKVRVFSALLSYGHYYAGLSCTLHPHDCKNVTVLAPVVEASNTDGIDPGKCILFGVFPQTLCLMEWIMSILFIYPLQSL